MMVVKTMIVESEGWEWASYLTGMESGGEEGVVIPLGESM